MFQTVTMDSSADCEHVTVHVRNIFFGENFDHIHFIKTFMALN